MHNYQYYNYCYCYCYYYYYYEISKQIGRNKRTVLLYGMESSYANKNFYLSANELVYIL
jgi:hypothetical protein